MLHAWEAKLVAVDAGMLQKRQLFLSNLLLTEEQPNIVDKVLNVLAYKLKIFFEDCLSLESLQ